MTFKNIYIWLLDALKKITVPSLRGSRGKSVDENVETSRDVVDGLIEVEARYGAN
jgi:hypothetical protein